MAVAPGQLVSWLVLRVGAPAPQTIVKAAGLIVLSYSARHRRPFLPAAGGDGVPGLGTREPGHGATARRLHARRVAIVFLGNSQR